MDEAIRSPSFGREGLDSTKDVNDAFGFLSELFDAIFTIRLVLIDQQLTFRTLHSNDMKNNELQIIERICNEKWNSELQQLFWNLESNGEVVHTPFPIRKCRRDSCCF